MKYFLTCTLCLFIFHFNYAQSDIPLIPSDSLINKAVQMMDNGKLEESMKLLDRVSALSPDYPKAQYEYAYAAYSNKEYEKALEVLNKITIDSDMNHQFNYHQLKANVYDELKDTINARESYEYLVEHFPYQASGYFDYALFQIHVDEHYEAAKNLQKALYLNPTFYKAHYLLGILAVENGYYSEGIISCLTALYLYPENNYNSSALINLNKFLLTVDPDAIKLDLHDGKDNPFKDIEKLLKSEFALSSDYNNETKFTDKFMNQIHLFWFAFDKVKETGSFYNEFYIPFWKEVKKDLDFNTLACILHYKIDSKAVQREVKKESRNIGVSYEHFSERYSDILYYRNYDLKGNSRKVFYNIKNGDLSSVGPYDGKKIHGDWQYLYPAHGVHSYSIQYDENGKAQGESEFYNLDGTLKKKITYKDNSINGWEIFYDKMGKEISRFYYENDKIEKESLIKYPNGDIQCSRSYKADKLNGPYICFYPDGTKRIELEFVDDVANGQKKYYNVNGQIAEEYSLKNDEIDGPYKWYYGDGTLANEENYKEGKRVGEQKYYFANGKLKKISNYSKNGEIEDYKVYNMLGNLVESCEYNSKEELHGDYIQYFYDGKKKNITTYKNGTVKNYKTFDYKGDLIQDVKVQNKELNTYLNILGDPISKGKKIRNKLLGKWSYFYPSGTLKSTNTYNSNANTSGESIDYHTNGQVKSILNYKDGKAEGLYQEFYHNGVLRREGTYYNDVMIGEWRDYSPDKSIEKIMFYDIKGDLIKWQELNKEGIPMYTYFFENEPMTKLMDHVRDTMYVLSEFPEDQSIVIPKGGSHIEFYMKNGVRHGQWKSYDSLQNVSLVRSYTNGKLNGEEIRYNTLGNIVQQINYIAGKQWGTKKSYNYAGVLSATREKKNGKTFGKYTAYYMNGTKRLEYLMENSETVSTVDYFGSNGELLFSKYEDNDFIYGYTLANQPFQVAPKGNANVVAHYKNGNKGIEIDYQGGEIHGKYNFYYENGNPCIKSSREYGDYQGDYIVYYPNGQMFYKENYELGSLHGPVEVFNDKGEIMAKLNFYYDKLDGEIEIYENNQLKYTKIYDLGYVLQVKVH